MAEILEKDHPILRQIAKEIPLDEIKGPRIQKIIRDMKKALYYQDDGVAIAAPQIGHSLRLFVVSGKVLSIIKDEAHDPAKHQDLVFINPVILKRSRQKEFMEEGCLSARWLYGKVKRSTKVLISALDENGTVFTKGGSGLMAQIFQHETDHLEGVLFLDTAVEIENVPPPPINQNL